MFAEGIKGVARRYQRGNQNIVKRYPEGIKGVTKMYQMEIRKYKK